MIYFKIIVSFTNFFHSMKLRSHSMELRSHSMELEREVIEYKFSTNKKLSNL
jgi:hypothetical protein